MSSKSTSFSHYNKVLSEKLARIPLFDTLEKKSGLNRVNLFLIMVVGFALFVLFGFGGGALSNLVGFVGPVYMSFKALKTETKEDDEFWLTYWVVYGFFSLFESFFGWVLMFVPFYYFVKVAFLLYCWLPQWKGALVIYKSLIRPMLSKYESKIDTHIDSTKSSLGQVGSEVASASKTLLAENGAALLSAGAQVISDAQQRKQ